MKSPRMHALLAFTLILSTFVSCGGVVFFSGTSDGSNIIVVTGTCTDAHLVSIVDANGSFITITVVNLFADGHYSTFSFCGDIKDRLPLNSAVSINFTNGTTCSNVNSIAIM